MRVTLAPQTTWDRGLFASAAALTLIGAVAMASAGTTVQPDLALRHAVWIGIGLLGCAGIARTNAHQWMDLAAIAYGVSLALLGLVYVAGVVRLGATRWLSVSGLSIQPSELAKLTTTLLLARYVAGQPSPFPMRAVWISLALVGAPALLVFLQPDLGSATVFGAIWLGMMWVAGVPRRAFAGLAGGLLALAPLGWVLLRDYQRDRLLAFVNPHADPLGAGFSVIQSTIAIGAGQWWGRGWWGGTQTHLRFLPERHSDFIFSVIGEEWGFLGSITVIGLLGVLLFRILRLALRVLAPEWRGVAVGMFCWVAYQAVVNLGMVSGLLPVVGVPLPLVSYGGSSMVTLWIALGMLQSVHRTSLTST